MELSDICALKFGRNLEIEDTAYCGSDVDKAAGYANRGYVLFSIDTIAQAQRKAILGGCRYDRRDFYKYLIEIGRQQNI
jgi:hypothetical protein